MPRCRAAGCPHFTDTQFCTEHKSRSASSTGPALISIQQSCRQQECYAREHEERARARAAHRETVLTHYAAHRAELEAYQRSDPAGYTRWMDMQIAILANNAAAQSATPGPAPDTTLAAQRAAVTNFENFRTLSTQSREIAAGRRDICALLLGVATAERQGAISTDQKALLKEMLILEQFDAVPCKELLMCLGEAGLARRMSDPPLRLAGLRPPPFAAATPDGVDSQLRGVTLVSP